MLQALYNEINKHRSAPCKVDPYLERAAARHARDMQVHGFASHIGSDGSTFITRVKDEGAPFEPSGEILVVGPGGKNCIQSVVKAWLGSEGHRAIMLDPSNKLFGGGYCLKNETYRGNYWVVVFAR